MIALHVGSFSKALRRQTSLRRCEGELQTGAAAMQHFSCNLGTAYAAESRGASPSAVSCVESSSHARQALGPLDKTAKARPRVLPEHGRLPRNGSGRCNLRHVLGRRVKGEGRNIRKWQRRKKKAGRQAHQDESVQHRIRNENTAKLANKRSKQHKERHAKLPRHSTAVTKNRCLKKF